MGRLGSAGGEQCEQGKDGAVVAEGHGLASSRLMVLVICWRAALSLQMACS
jgi:hypothetical protein